jgi:APA family basic amino acid/polyamine antiporter
LRNGTPAIALTSNFAIAICFAATGSYESLLATTAGLNFALFILVNFSAIALRRSEPRLRRPFRVPLHPFPEILAIGVNASLLLALIWEETFFTLLGFGVLLVITVIYLSTKRTELPSHFAASLPSEQ